MQDTKQIIFYKSQTGDIKINVFLKDETLWLSQKMMAELFGVQENNITYHIKEIYNSGELDNNSTTQKIGVVQKEGNREVKRNIDFYNLDVIIAVGYRVNSLQATQFRIWATNVLKEFIIKGFVMDDERLKNGDKFGKKYFEELLERIRDIRTSERIFYQKLTDLYSLSADYDKESETTKHFFATIQNKLHYAISGNTAAEIIYDRVDSEKDNMGLTNWKDSPKGKIMKSDVSIAKNYLDEKEIKSLNLLVNAYLDIAEMQAMEGQIMIMQDWKERIDDFLKGARKNILENAGKITHKLAKEKAEKEYDKFKPKQDLLYKNDFDLLLEEVKQKKLN
ncbi:cell filamentation protein Fic [Candidatus Gracilibacteria bacterium]|nr:cell filamentation protein Fic [Candidatus Gracilibacteria bacterium]